MADKPKIVWGLVLTVVLCHNNILQVEAQNTDGDLRVNFYRFALKLLPSNAVSCDATTAEAVRNVAEDCLQAFAPNSCDAIFAPGPGLPEQILLGGAECRGEDDSILVYGGAMDFSQEPAAQRLVDQCVLETLEGVQCLSFFQNAFPNVQDLVYSVDTPQPTSAPTLSPSLQPTTTPTALPSAGPTFVPTGAPTAPPSSTPTLLRATSSPSAAPSTVPTRNPTSNSVKGGIVEDGAAQPKQSTEGPSSLGIYIGAAACGVCLLLLMLLFVAKRRRRVEEESKEVTATDTKAGGLHSLDSLHPQPVPPPPGILLHNSNPHTSPRAQSRGFHSLPDDDYSAPGTSIGDPDLTLVSSVDMGSTDGSDSFVDYTRTVSLTISKDMLGGSSEVPRNRNAVLSRLGATLTPALVLSSSSDDGDSPPSPATRKKSGFQRLIDDEDDGTDEELLLEIPNTSETVNPEDFAPDAEWDPDDSEVGEDGEEEGANMFKKRSSPVCVDDPEADIQLPMPPELKNSTRRKPRSSTPRNVLGGGRTSPAVGSSSSGSSG